MTVSASDAGKPVGDAIFDRVAKAIWDAAYISENVDQEMAERLARAAIEAMREPTEEMVDVVFAAQLNDDDGYTRLIWEKMIDTALNPSRTSVSAAPQPSAADPHEA